MLDGERSGENLGSHPNPVGSKVETLGFPIVLERAGMWQHGNSDLHKFSKGQLFPRA